MPLGVLANRRVNPVLTTICKKRSFRDSRIAASLKLAVSLQPPRCRTPTFRDSRIAASLKRCEESGVESIHSYFPRFTNRGLIEAFSIALALLNTDAFRDSRIAASLKPRNQRSITRCTSSFRDSRIAASLKRPPCVDLHETKGTFRDSRIAASLKRTFDYVDETAADDFPRFTNRGLIEASSFLNRLSREASFPRFTNRGLIEARIHVERFPQPPIPFRDSRIAASLKRHRSPRMRSC